MLAVIIICLVAFVSLPAQSKKRTMKGKSRPRRRPSPRKVSLDIGMLMAEVATGYAQGQAWRARGSGASRRSAESVGE